MSSAQIAPADHVCYVHCSFCNTVLAVCKLIYLYVSLCCLLRIDDLSLYHFLSLSLPLYLMISDCLRENHPSSSSVHHHTIGMFHLHDLLATLFQLLFLLAALVEAWESSTFISPNYTKKSSQLAFFMIFPLTSAPSVSSNLVHVFLFGSPTLSVLRFLVPSERKFSIVWGQVHRSIGQFAGCRSIWICTSESSQDLFIGCSLCTVLLYMIFFGGGYDKIPALSLVFNNLKLVGNSMHVPEFYLTVPYLSWGLVWTLKFPPILIEEDWGRKLAKGEFGVKGIRND